MINGESLIITTYSPSDNPKSKPEYLEQEFRQNKTKNPDKFHTVQIKPFFLTKPQNYKSKVPKV